MKIKLCLDWMNKGASVPKTFKLSAYYSILSEYQNRINPYCSFEIIGSLNQTAPSQTATHVWICDRGTGSKMLSSEDMARHLSRLLDGGIKELWVVIGGPDGFSDNRIQQLGPKLKWCFGPLTLPHELASVVASEQIYRAWSIINHHPYHSGH